MAFKTVLEGVMTEASVSNGDVGKSTSPSGPRRTTSESLLAEASERGGGERVGGERDALCCKGSSPRLPSASKYPNGRGGGEARGL